MPHLALVADADPGVTGLVAAALRRAGYEVRTLAGPWELDPAPDSPPALAVVGGAGRGVTAADTALALRLAGDPTPVIVLINRDDPDAAALAAADPTVRLLPKPFAPAGLVATAAGLVRTGAVGGCDP